jgi:hypothetical protein
MCAFRNVFACLVHEDRDCVIDLVRNLRCLDPDSDILLYNGGDDPGLLDASIFASRYDAYIFPTPTRMFWGRLHAFALDCMAYATQALRFDTLTIVDSDQLLIRPGYSGYLPSRLRRLPQHIGLLGRTTQPQPPSCGGPARSAYAEIDLWRPWLRRFPDGEAKFPYWTHWGATVFTVEAVRALLDRIRTDKQLCDIIARSRIISTEEVILTSLVALLGFEIALNPCSNDYVRWRVSFSNAELTAALKRSDVFWLHPAPRRYDDPLRSRIRALHDYYNRVFILPAALSAADAANSR